MSLNDEKPVQDTETFDFGIKKKKKKKAVPDFDDDSQQQESEQTTILADDDAAAEPAATGAAAEDDDAANVFADLKKKKKKKKATFEGDDTPTGTTEDGADAEGADDADASGAAAAPAEEFVFGEKKKKKRSKKTDLADFEAALKDGTESVGVEETAAGEETAGAKASEGEPWLGSTRDYTYEELLHRVFSVLRENNPDLVGDKKRYTIAPPQVLREGTKKTLFANVVDICKRMHRQPDHVIQFLFAELGTTGSIDGAQRLVIKGRFQPKQIENVLKRYIMEYVTCKTCKSADTIMMKENRLFFLQCESCGSTRTVSAIKTGFVAQTRDARKAARANA
ncbi:eukaryotic translation initiation factor 2 beta [Fimicolochytrium jonesii]|uniref:eukaryotic translation initiation factor 2 beta n=1 Tax=Fimicolochytrium jonesii TaxID=1396493 RepID=UPI0022FE3CEE|nr:eukaryotic translation initiation factor 2 beta [Fimicolochytrium jonesii]KAI8824556.1 eukaryotic translation initiation factor 2 beta [Fimicolochytrium jonesii]